MSANSIRDTNRNSIRDRPQFKDNPWSVPYSHALKPHSLYQALGKDVASRAAAYRELVRFELEPGLVDEIRRATNGNYALGNAAFAAQVSAALGRRAVPGKSGRPRRAVEPETGKLFGE